MYILIQHQTQIIYFKAMKTFMLIFNAILLDWENEDEMIKSTTSFQHYAQYYIGKELSNYLSTQP